MAKCALLNNKTWEIDNVIVAGPNDSPPDGYVMVVIPDNIPAGPGWKFATGVGFVSPDDAELVDIKQAEVVDKPNKQEILDARQAALDAAAAARQEAMEALSDSQLMDQAAEGAVR